MWSTPGNVLPLVIVLTLLQVVSQSASQELSVEVKCLPRLVVLETDPTSRSTVPRFYTVQRCSGGVKDTKAFQCQPTSTSTVQKTIIHSATLSKEVIKVVNHLACAETCVCQICMSTNEAPQKATCERGERWDPNTCRCLPFCHKGVQSTEGNGGGGDGISIAALVGAMFAEFIAICIVGFLLFDLHRCRKQHGFLHQASVYVKSTSTRPSTNSTSLNPVDSAAKTHGSIDDIVFEPTQDECAEESRLTDGDKQV